ncbi:LysR family transcriptional regulator [Aeromonas sp. 6P]|uniref:LysR family transcriptional regulator n=1 Tax=Aeromonas sp. 6P TaxID=3452722 RepID=UPI003F791434
MEKIDIRQMRVLVLLVRYKSVSRVAELLEISQQGVSSHLKKLRELFPAELFIRQSAGLQPTDYACELADKFEQILADIDGVFVAAPFDPASSQRTFRVMANEYAQLAIIPRLASALRTQAPSIRLDVVDFQTEQHLDALASGEVDLVIGFDAYLDPGLLRSTLRRDHYCCVLRRDSRYLPDNAPQDLAAIPFVQFANSVGNFEGQIARSRLPTRRWRRSPVIPRCKPLCRSMTWRPAFHRPSPPSAIFAPWSWPGRRSRSRWWSADTAKVRAISPSSGWPR